MAGERQELRIALVMNGGVSLAVWMGGVTLELDRVRRADGLYGELLELTSTDARVDVIAGASAGGINGAVLALAIARRTTVEQIRELWMADGDIDLLMRDPMQRNAPSVLQGDDVLLARLAEAMREVGAGGVASDPTGAPLYLAVTGTILKGQTSIYHDCFGVAISDVSHRALFEFRRSAYGGGEDDFAPSEGPGDEAALRLALAARSSASFPGAFEPSFVPVREETEPSPRDPVHPNMRGVANFTSDRWVIDGGVLDNTPFGPALDEIRALPAERPVRRVLGFVVPDIAIHDEEQLDMPSAGGVVLDALSKLPRAQSIGRELAEIEENNRAVRKRREARASALTMLEGDSLEEAARLLLPTYLEVRRVEAIEDLVRLAVAVGGKATQVTGQQVDGLRDVLRRFPDPPWLPAESAEAFDADASVEGWRWGFAPLETMGNLALEVVQKLGKAGSTDGSSAVNQLRGEVHDALHTLREVQQESDEYWENNAEIMLEAPVAVEPLTAYWGALYSARFGELAFELAGILQDARERFGTAKGDGDSREALAMLASLGETPERIVRRLLALDVVHRATGADLGGIEQEVELVLMSTQTPNSFGLQLLPEQKLAGLQVAHFGAFYKSSWRANDWAWGRLDGADRMVRTLLDPRRIKSLLDGYETREADRVAEVAERIRRISCDSADADVAVWLAARFDGERVHDELRALAVSTGEPLLTDLPCCYEAIRLRAQIEIAVEEVPGIARAVRVDKEAGAWAGSLGARWEREHAAGDAPLSVQQCFDAVKACDIGRERIEEEIGSDRFTSVSTKGLAVVGSVLGGALPGVKVLQPALSAIRGLMLTLYLLGRGVTEGTDTGRFLVALTLAVGGALVGVYAIGMNVPGLLLLLGSIVLMAGVLLSVLQKRRWQLLLTALVLGGSAAGFWSVRLWHGRPGWVDALASVLAVVLMAGGATLLGRSNRPRRGS